MGDWFLMVTNSSTKRYPSSGSLSPIGIDVFCDEPPLENRDGLLSDRRVIATGHYAWYSIPASKELQRRAGENMAKFLSGEMPEDCLNP
jgi:lactate dehydrogenase-like 2-hydroxyacid dehydrogenase